MDLVARVDTLGAVSDLEIHTAPEAGLLLQDRDADILGHTGVDRGFIDHHGTWDQITSHNAGGILDREQIRGLILLNGGRNRDDQELTFRKALFIRGEVHGGRFDCFIAYFMGRVDASFVLLNTPLIVVEAQDLHMLGEFHGNGHANVTKADQGQFLFSRDKAVIQGVDIVHSL